MGISLRRAVLADMDWILAELKRFSDFFESEHSLFSEDDDFNRNTIKLLIENHYFLVSLKDNVKSGFIAGLSSVHLFNPKIKTLTELFWWVSPEFRNSKSGAALLNDFVKYGEQFDWVIMTLENNSPVGFESILSRGFKFKEQSFIMENKRGE